MANFHPTQPEVVATNGIVYGTPSVELYLYHPFALARRLQSAGNPRWKEIVENMVITSIIHEFDHLAFETNDVSGLPVDAPQHLSFDFRADCERKAWALTCEHVLSILVERYNVPLDETNALFYGCWVQCGRNADDPRWIEAIRRIHAAFER